ncbi:HNH endonuclease [Alkalihalobacterium alkalinitrilicum]|uniref:HNH endonuclease n=1 Tax=Alkalihalobacterium alkalinitrilicum TaxID=427920 RepID=UPI000994FBF4|nr:HNH endonuclease signature motif containing protein [Alkalihalobacterium alkalinitrilicum]
MVYKKLGVKTSEKADQFYHSTPWRKIRILALERDQHRCLPCWRKGVLTIANTVHHIKPRKEYPELELTLSNLESICPACHNKEHPDRGKQRKKKKHRINVVEERGNPEMI